MFRSMTPAQRLEHLKELLDLPASDVALLSEAGALPLDIADGMIENVIGKFELPYAVASNFQINGRDVIVPLVVEEPSVVAAASFMAKLAREAGGFKTSSSLPLTRASSDRRN
jgi:hydroxymethylglutaryl-CoA reductase